MYATAPSAFKDLAALLGREEAMHSVHSTILRAAHMVRPVVESGAVLAACSDEFNGELRSAFDRDVARQLSAPEIPGTRRVFAVSNLGGRIEPGAIALANLHFSARSTQRGEKLLLIEIAGHVGRRETNEGTRWGELDRFGTPSPCCGALRLLLDAPQAAAAVRFPWFDQLTAFFGPERLGALRSDRSPHAMVRAAVVHAVLQSESAIVDLLREPPTTPTQVLLVALVCVNRRGTDNAIVVGFHHLRFADGEMEELHGVGLRSTPTELAIDASKTHIVVSSPFEPAGAAPAASKGELTLPAPRPPVTAGLHGSAGKASVREHVARARRQLQKLRQRTHGLDVHSRIVLRAFLQGLSMHAPDVGLSALALDGKRKLFQALELEKLVRGGPSLAEARRILHDIEPTLQQLTHNEAREVLEALLSEQHPLLGG